MRTEINIIDGEAKITLHAENDFEKDLIERIKESRKGYKIDTEVLTAYNYQAHSKHRIEISLLEKKD